MIRAYPSLFGSLLMMDEKLWKFYVSIIWEVATKPQIISLYGELTSLKKQESESVTDYVIRAERASTLLKNVGENVSDGLLIAMLIRGLPDLFKAFITVITQEDDVSFEHFKSALRSYEENEKARLQQCEGDEVMVFTQRGNLKCFSCGKEGHKKFSVARRETKVEKYGDMILQVKNRMMVDGAEIVEAKPVDMSIVANRKERRN